MLINASTKRIIWLADTFLRKSDLEHPAMISTIPAAFKQHVNHNQKPRYAYVALFESFDMEKIAWKSTKNQYLIWSFF